MTSVPGGTSAIQLRSASGGVVVMTLPAHPRFDALRLTVKELLASPPGRFAGARFRIDLGDRELDLLEIRRLSHLLKDEYEIQLVGLECSPHQLQRLAERELKLKIHTHQVVEAPIEEPAPAAAPLPAGEESPTTLVTPADPDPEEVDGARVLTLNSTVRSGAVVRFSGDIVVFGDVNPGAHLVAGGNIVVMGALKGLAHAGTRPDLADTAVIVALDLRPTQLRVGKVIGLSIDAEPDAPGRGFRPEIAYIQAGNIVIEPYRGRLPDAVHRTLSTGAPSESKETP